MKMTRGSKFFADTPPANGDSETCRAAQACRARIFGRTNTCELGLSLTCEPRLYGPTRNPWDLTRISGWLERRSGGRGGRAHAADGARHRTDSARFVRLLRAAAGRV